MLRFIYIILLIFSLFSCTQETATKTTAFVGGEIVNPKDTYFKLYQNDKLIDSTALDNSGRFGLQLDTIKEGLYYFSHGKEFQYLYITPGDSLMLRLNTLDFDESLAFCGAGSARNNLLVKLFLLNEKNEKEQHSSYTLETVAFLKQQKELIEEKEVLITDFKTNNTEVRLSSHFKQVLDVEVNYLENYRKEVYPIHYMQKHQLDSFPKLPADFYDFENTIDFNNESLTISRSYYLLLDAYFDRQTFLEYFEKRNKDIPASEQKDFVLHKLDKIVNKVQNKKVRDNLVEYNILRFTRMNPMQTDILEAFKDYLKELDNDSFKKDLEQIVHNYASLAMGKDAPKIYLHDTTENITSIQKLAKTKGTLFYFWTVENSQYIAGMHNRILALQKAFPRLNFIAINIDTPASNWKVLAQEKGLDLTALYQLENSSDLSKKLSISSLSNVIITKNGRIVTAFENLFSPQLPYILKATQGR